MTDAAGAGSGMKFGVLLRFDIALAVGAARDGNSYAGRPQDPRHEIFDTFTVCARRSSHSVDEGGDGTPVVPIRARRDQSMLRGCQEMTDAGDCPRMGFISYHRACVAKRQARARRLREC
jgi:hypothetical protein